jgi:hypothetical protein
MFCVKCGFKVQDDWKVCLGCAKPILHGAAIHAAKPAAIASPPPLDWARQHPTPIWVYSLLFLPVAALGIMFCSNWVAQLAEAERMKNPAYAEAKRKTEADWKEIRSAMRKLEAQRGVSRAAGASSATWTTPSVTPSSSPSRAAGDAIMVNPGFWVCGSTKEAFWAMTKEAVSGSREMFGTMRRTHSFALQDGAQVKVLDVGIVASKVRVLGQLDADDDRVHAYPEDARIGRECWVASEAVTGETSRRR